jgi:hypothetical protein
MPPPAAVWPDISPNRTLPPAKETLPNDKGTERNIRLTYDAFGFFRINACAGGASIRANDRSGGISC